MPDGSISWPPRHPLIAAPTPLIVPQQTVKAMGIDLRIKRDDLTGVAESGNKTRKLEFLVAEALRTGSDTLITCGGVNSNHARATAVVAARCGLTSHLVLRGADRKPPFGNLLLDRMLGATVTFIRGEQWTDRYEIMADVADRVRAAGRRPYVIPEGGSNALGSLGYADVIPELIGQVENSGGVLRRIVHATGSGGTTAGLALGLAAAERTDIDVVGVAVCNDQTYFDGRIEEILEETVQRNWTTDAIRKRARWSILEGYKGRGYGQTTAEEMAEHAALARADGLFVDPIYTGKAFRAVRAEVRAGRWSDGTTVFLHTGGIFELFAFSAEIDALPAPNF